MAKAKAYFRVLCTSKTERDRNPDGNIGPKWVFSRPFKGAETPAQAIKLARDYARKKGIDPRDYRFETFEWN